jgi:hypothetical protein
MIRRMLEVSSGLGENDIQEFAQQPEVCKPCNCIEVRSD